MSIKSESPIMRYDDVESGQCSDDEIRILKREKNLKKHKRKDGSRKDRKRKVSNPYFFERHPEFFNPYCVNPGKLCCKTECVQLIAPPIDRLTDKQESDICKDIISETFNSLSAIDSDLTVEKPRTDVIVAVKCIFDKDSVDPIREFHLKEIIKRRETQCGIDLSGIDTITSDLYHYLIDLGLSRILINDLLHVLSKEKNNIDETPANHEDDDGYEEDIINEIPVIEQPQHSDCGYSPEHANDLVEPYKPCARYAPTFSYNNNQMRRLGCIIDPFSIPEVGPRDPRLINTKILLQTKQNSIHKPSEIEVEKITTAQEVNPLTTKEWETTVINVVKTHLRLYLIHDDINKDEYKSILKRSVIKILSSGEKKLETDKISKFIHSYVTVTQRSRCLNNG